MTQEGPDLVESGAQAADRGFVHLHLHTEYSLLDGANHVDRLIARVKDLGMDAVAVTDHGNLFGALTFYDRAVAAGIKPILGCEAYVAPGSRHDRTHTGVADGGFHLVLLAETDEGWRNLMYLASQAYLEGFYYKPRVDRELLASHNAGLIAIDGHLGSELAHHLVEYEKTGDEAHYRHACDAAGWKQNTFSPTARGPRFFVELQRHIGEQNVINPHLVRLAREMDLPLVATNDAHFLLEDDHDAHDTLICISTGKLKSEPNRMRYPRELYVKSPEQMREAFEGAYGEAGVEACDNTMRIAERCDVRLEHRNHAPLVRVRREGAAPDPNKFDDRTAWYEAFCAQYDVKPIDPEEAEASGEALEAQCDQTLRDLCEAGLIWRYGPELAPDAPPPADEDRRARIAAIRARLDRELSVLIEKSITPYFLIVWDFVSWGRAQGIPALARGSGVGTMVGYVLGLSNACPVKYGLLFERFTDPDRSEYPDIDIDLCQNGRGEVIEYVRRKYGHVAQIITFGTLKARAAVRDVGRVLDVPLADVDRVAKMIPEALGTTLDSALEQEPDLKSLYDEDENVRRVIDTARRLEGQVRHASVHAAGVIVATRPLHEIVPLYKQSGGEDVITQWDGPTCEKVGLLKMDFLGLRTLSTIERCKELVRGTLPEEAIRDAVGWREDQPADPLDLDRLTLDDPKVFELFQRADTTGVFQFESGGMRRLLTEMQPDRLEDLIAANALFRPGPMDLVPTYNRRKHGQEEVPSVHPIVDKHTAETFGVMVYQEQVMQIVHELGGIPLRQAYTLIKAISKKKKDVIDANRPVFIDGAVDKGLSREQAEELFDLILKFAGYGFNKSHSTGYAIVAYQTAYLKTYFPNQYMAAFLTFESQAQKIAAWSPYLEDCRRVVFPGGKVGVEVRPPDVNLSDADFTVVFGEDEPRTNEGGHVRFGMRAIKGAGGRAIERIVEERRRGGPYSSLHDFCERVASGTVNKATIESLVKCGAFDSVHGREKRAAMAATIESAVAAGQSAAQDRAAGQGGLFGAGGEDADDGFGAEASGGPPLTRAEPWSEMESLAHEKEALGFFVSSHPLDRWEETIRAFADTDSGALKSRRQGQRVVVGGLAQSVRTIVTRKGKRAGQKMAVVTMEDRSGVFEAVLFPEAYARHDALVREDAILLMAGEVDQQRGDAQLIVDRVVPVERARFELAQAVEVVLDERRLNGEGVSTLRLLKDLVRSHAMTSSASEEGPSPVSLRFVVCAGDRRVRMEGGSWARLQPTERLLGRLEETVGEGCVRLVGAGGG